MAKKKKTAKSRAKPNAGPTLMNFMVKNRRERTALHEKAEKLGYTTTAAFLREAAFSFKTKAKR